MDVAYNQHSSMARRKNRSSTNLNHLSLAPLTSKLPLQDDDELADSLPYTPSYLQGKSAPTTPRLLSRSPARSRSRGAPLPKSKSATHLAPAANSSSRRTGGRQAASVAASPAAKRRSHDVNGLHRTDSDWLLRAGALISTETREFKGQAWLVSRASSTSLARMRGVDDEETAYERELAHEREQLAASRSASRRHSLGYVADDDNVSPASRLSSPSHSRFGSRSQSRHGSRSQMMTPLDMRSVDGYFASTATSRVDDDGIPGPDFVNLDESLEEVDEFDTTVDDEAYVKRLVKKGNGGMGTWIGSVLGVQLFSVEEDEEESDGDDEEGDSTEGELDEEVQERRASSLRRLEGRPSTMNEDITPPKADEGGWHDAAWLLSVASKVLL